MDAGFNPGSPVCGLGKQLKMAPKPQDSAPVWETQQGFVDPGFGSAYLWPLQPLGEGING